MELADKIFKRKTYCADKLLKYGFSEKNGRFVYSELITDGQFRFTVEITDSGITTDVIELALNEPFVLYRIDNASGAFVGRIRAEAERILLDIADKCFYTEIFKSRQAKMITEYLQERYGDKIEFLWNRFPDNAVFRRQDNRKWYGVLLTVERKKIGLDGDGTVEVVDLREDPEIVSALTDGKTYFAGYHMNKRHWYTICLDDTVTDSELRQRIDKSYTIARKK